MMRTVDRLLREPADFVAWVCETPNPVAAARALVLVVLACGGIFGAALGLYRGGLQVVYAAVKLPLVLLLTAGICAPVFACARWALGATPTFRRDLICVLAALALTSLAVAGMTPLVLLGIVVEIGYHKLILLTVGICATGGVFGLRLFLQALEARQTVGRTFVAGLLLSTFMLVGAQMSWTLRPYLVRPRTTQPPIVRTLEGGFLEAVGTSLRSAGGLYERDYAPLPEER